jgi:DNA-binding winged helix-turn-helix (wHTH) protein/Tfp pilus assembly protein PilF
MLHWLLPHTDAITMPSAPLSPAVVRFGVFEADLRAGELRRNGAKVRIQELPFRALTLLLTRPGEVVTRDELRKALWPSDVFVDFEQGISSAMMRLRDALGDSADNPVFIQTIERRGYRWIAPVRHCEPPATEATAAPVEAPKATPFFPWRKLVFALPLLVLLLAAWSLRPIRSDSRVTAQSNPPAARNLHSPNREAEDLYLKGRVYWNKRTSESLQQAVDAFNQAIAVDPNYADAYVGLADCYNLLREFSAIPANEAYFKALAAARKAVELDPQSSEAHATLAFVTFWGIWDASDAEKEFRRAIELDPKNSKAHHWFATFLLALSRQEEALGEIEIARKLDPNASSVLADKGELLLWTAGRFDDGLQLLRQLESAEPDFVSPHRYLKSAYFMTRDYPNYLAELGKEAVLTHDLAELAEARAAAKGWAKGGERGLLEAQLVEEKKSYKDGKMSAFFVAETEARLGHTQEALNYLNICLHSHDDHVISLGRNPVFAGLHGDPAFQKLLATVGIPPLT